ncbi:MAG: hypothetical protein CSA34_05310 [Desulfobulbus propionicus]|nr:MAG: hypothetical protein CSA34_05310 [Desulfobulbus propionicus]
MRCPKCGFISFDHLERCKKCKKKVGSSAKALNGTIYDTPSPFFLKFSLPEEEPVATPMSPSPAGEAELERLTKEDKIGVEGEPEVEFSLETPAEDDSAATELDLEDGEELLDFDDLEEAAPVEEPMLDLGEVATDETGVQEAADEPETAVPAEEKKTDDRHLDFGDMDISDLAPSAKEETVATVTDEIPATTASLTDAAGTEDRVATGLEDLQVEGFALEESLETMGEVATKAVKTGTALDEFDVDLGELLTTPEK